MTDDAPFIVYATPRSRTAWLAKLLTYGSWHCYHEHAVFLRDVPGVKAFFNQRHIGSVETAAAAGWRILAHHFPQMRRVVIRRPLEAVVASCLAIDLNGVAKYDERRLWKTQAYMGRYLAEIAGQPGVLALDFADLDREDGCAAIFEHCLRQPFNRTWWEYLRGQNIQMDVPAHLRYYHENIAAVSAFKRKCWSELRRLVETGAISNPGRA